MAEIKEESRMESANKPRLSSLQETLVPSASLIDLQLAYIRALAGKGLIEIRKV